MFGRLKEFVDSAPKLIDQQRMLQTAFNELSQERGKDMPVTRHQVESSSLPMPYPIDLMVQSIKQIDSHYLELRNNKLKRDAEKARERAKHG